jgi:hypothetical protein
MWACTILMHISVSAANQQRLFNKFVREKVETRLGKDFLLLHEIQEINSDIMEEIKSKHNSFTLNLD